MYPMPKRVEIEISELRKRLRGAIDRSRRLAAERRAAIDAASAAYAVFLEEKAGPLAQMLASALKAEGYNFLVFTPSGTVRLSSAKSGDDYVEFSLDTSQREPVVLLRVNRARGRRVVQHERAVKEHTAVEKLTEEDVLAALLEEIGPFVER
jgi:hypothetical protein